MYIYTMGFTQKSAETFFEKIIDNKIELLLDIRLNNQSQLAGFTKGKDLKYFLRVICGCIFTFLQLNVFLEIIACLRIVFPVESDIP